MCKQIAMSWLFFNKANTVLLITVDLPVEKWQVQEKGVTEKLKKINKSKREVKVQFKREPLIIFHYPD